MNIFKLARRISLVVAGLAIIYAIYYATTYKPYLMVSYSISDPLSKPIKIKNEELCPEKGEYVNFIRSTKLGAPYIVYICLLPIEFGEDQQLLIPYKVDSDNTIYGAENFSAEVHNYKKKVEDSFVLSKTENASIERDTSHLYWKNWIKVLLFLIFSLLVFRRLIWFIGLIVRRKMEIPSGMDKKPMCDI